jgi:putative phosphoesterase
MKIAVISDLHGNSLALDAVLGDISTENADEIWCCGDLAMAGYDPNYVIEKIKTLKVRSIFGNTDWMILNYDENLLGQTLSAASAMGYALQNDVKIITPENKEFLRSLPQNETIELMGKKFFLCHGSPRRVDENIFPDTPLDVVEKMCESTDADVIFCGHTHIPCGFQLNSGKSVVNVGSVGRPMQDDKRAVWVLLEVFDGGEFEITHKFTKYDNIAAAKKVTERGLPECTKLAALLLKEGELGAIS